MKKKKKPTATKWRHKFVQRAATEVREEVRRELRHETERKGEGSQALHPTRSSFVVTSYLPSWGELRRFAPIQKAMVVAAPRSQPRMNRVIM